MQAIAQTALPAPGNQGDNPLAGTRGQLYDHIGLSVQNLDAWIAKLRGEGVKFVSDGAYKFGDTRAVMIEGPSKEALALVPRHSGFDELILAGSSAGKVD